MAQFPHGPGRIYLGGLLEYSGFSPPRYTLQDVETTQDDDVAISSYADFVRQGNFSGDVRF